MSEKFKTVSCLGYNIFTDDLNLLPLKSKIVVNTINQYSYCIADEDSDFKMALKKSDVLLPDGVGITFVSRFLNGISIKKIAGADLHHNLLERMEREKGSCFYLGASEDTLRLIRTKIKKEYPNIRIETYSPPYKAAFTEEDSNQMINCVNQFKPDVLFVGMTAPKQEKWSYDHKDLLNAHVICSIGAVFDFYAGNVQRPHKIWIDMGLEWFGRFIKEPKRMWKRYFYYGFIFLFKIFKKNRA